MEVSSKSIKEQFTFSELQVNYQEVMKQVNEVIRKNDWELMVNGVDNYLNSIQLDLNNLSLNARKKIAKRLYYLKNKQTRRNINMLFLQLKRIGAINDKVFIPFNKKERDIQIKRKMWLALRDEADKALWDYKLEKGNYYKNKL